MAAPAAPARIVDKPEASAGAAARVGNAVEWAMGLLLIGVVAVNVVNAAGRYLFSQAITGADELMVYALIFVVMAGAVLALAGRQHINVNVLPAYATGRRRYALYILHDLIALAATAYTAQASWAYVERIARLDTRSMALGIPMTIPHAAVLAGFAGMAIVALVCLIRDVRAFAANAPEPQSESGREAVR